MESRKYQIIISVMASRGPGHSLLIWWAFVCLCGVVITSTTATDVQECPANEFYTNCTLIHCYKDCKDLGAPVACPSVSSDCDVPGCVCRDDWLRNENGTCVPTSECVQECPANEFKTNCTLTYCKQDCKNLGVPVTCPSVSSDCDVPGCVCQDDWLRNENGTCVPTSQCNAGCGVNEYSVGANGCQDVCATTCATRYSTRPRACPAICILGGCNCKSGYLRNDNGTCVLPEDCSAPVCESDETFKSCGTACESSCDKPNPICTRQCKAGCFCNPGTIRGPYGNCIKQEECPPIVCGENQVNTTCKKLCPPPTCGNMYASPCFAPDICENGCDCKEGYYRNGPDIYNDACIPASECPAVQPECPEDEAYSTCGTCEKTCDNYNKNLLCSTRCQKGCFCEKGKVRGSDGICVDPCQCSAQTTPDPEPVCDDGEAYTTCSSCEQTCDTYNRTDILCVAECQVGCFCESGKVRGPDNSCIDPAQCNATPKAQCADGEAYTDCGTCEKSCDTYNRTDIFCTADCKVGCFCKNRKVRGPAGTCIDPALCNATPDAQCADGEAYTDCGTCEKTCHTYNRTDIYCTADCRVGCFCEKGKIRGPNGSCINPSQCAENTAPVKKPRRTKCEHGETYTTCGMCERTCETYNKPLFCATYCRVGCFCQGGKVRGPNGDCIYPWKCYTLKSSSNAGSISGSTLNSGSNAGSTSGSSSNYGSNSKSSSESYSNYGQNTQSSSESQSQSSSSSNAGSSSESSSSSSSSDSGSSYRQCKENEIYRQCKKTCPPQTCFSIFARFSCLENSENSCEPGCDCTDGFLRNGTISDPCIPTNLCPGLPTEPTTTTPQCKENEVYNNCSITCPPQTCASIYSSYNCPLQEEGSDESCTPGCDCVSGYLRNGNNTDVCIPSEDCPSPQSTEEPPTDTTPITLQCNENEVYNNCLRTCPPQTCASINRQYKCREYTAANCKPGCDCKDGYLRNGTSTDLCISKTLCPSKETTTESPGTDCRADEVYDPCGSNCPARCPSRFKIGYVCTQQCVAGCFCKSGTVRAGDGSCIDPSSCPPINT